MSSCYECGEELWSAAEAGGYCVGCQLRAMRNDVDDPEESENESVPKEQDP